MENNKKVKATWDLHTLRIEIPVDREDLRESKSGRSFILYSGKKYIYDPISGIGIILVAIKPKKFVELPTGTLTQIYNNLEDNHE